MGNDLDSMSAINEEDIKISFHAIEEMESKKIFDEDATKLLKTEEGKEAFSEVVDVANQIFFGNQSHFQFEVHEQTGRVMLKVINDTTNKVIKEVPPEKILDAVAGIWELAGIIVDEKA